MLTRIGRVGCLISFDLSKIILFNSRNKLPQFAVRNINQFKILDAELIKFASFFIKKNFSLIFKEQKSYKNEVSLASGKNKGSLNGLYRLSFHKSFGSSY